jgi:hypothetical protein
MSPRKQLVTAVFFLFSFASIAEAQVATAELIGSVLDATGL